jgi:hypothetical protein
MALVQMLSGVFEGGEEQVETRSVEGQRSKLKKLTVGVQSALHKVVEPSFFGKLAS